ncbi:CIC11C00000001122 [Sungouiella intermedia]|uniref:CIC11C00000001122 n=1 Tax=Sungouiella intermedia TaxID=45354 RepID=A0A1L0DT84_9ASCO|nr:CIC11C00000001122 [[Candida] intermedia]
MKFSTPTLLAILATSAVVGAAPTTISEANTAGLIKKSDISDALSIIEELGQLNQKRAFVEDENELFELSKRADSLLGQLITTLTNSGIIGDVWHFLTTDSQLRTTLINVTKKAFSAALTYGPSVVKAIYNSGYIQKFFNLLYTDSLLRTTLFSVAKTIFGSGLNLLKAFLATKDGSTATNTAAAPASTPAAKREETLDFDPELYYDKRDALTIAQSVYNAIKLTGIVQGLVSKALADPNATISFLTSALKNGLVVVEDIYSWAKTSGVLDSAVNFLKTDGVKYAKAIATFLGNKIVNGSATVNDVDNAPGATTTTTAGTGAASGTQAKRRLY